MKSYINSILTNSSLFMYEFRVMKNNIVKS